MKGRGLIALAVVAAALGAILLVDLRRRPSDGDRGTTRERLLPPFDRKAVGRITIRRHGAGPFTLSRTAAPGAPAPAPAWSVDTPEKKAADDTAVQDLIAAADLAESDRVANIAPEAAGLEPPAVEIDIDAATGVLTAQLGRPDPAGQGVYARAGAPGPIRVVGRRLLELVDREPAAFRDRRLFPVDPTTVTSIAWTDAGGAGELRFVDGRWQNAGKEGVEEGRVIEGLRRLFALRIDQFDAAPPFSSGVPCALAVTAGAVRIALERPTCAGDITRGHDHLRVPTEAMDAATRALHASAVRDTRLIATPPDTVTSVDLSDDRARVSLRRVDGAWTFTAPKVAYPPDTRAVDEWLARLGALRTATRAEGPHARRLVVEGRFRQDVTVASPPDVYALLAPDPLRFRERTLLSFARFDVRRLQRQAGKATALLTSEDGTVWRTASGTDVDAANAARVAGALSDLRAEEFVAAPPAGEAPVRLDIDVQQPGDARAQRHAVHVWPQNDGGCVARLDGEATFRPERATCDALRLDLLKKAD